MISFGSYAQRSSGTSSGFGIRAGLNYNANGDFISSITENAENPDRSIGYHIGLYGKIGYELYFKPELVYTTTKSDYRSGDFDMQKLDAPLLIGYKIFGPISIFGGPSLQYIINTEFEDIDIDDIKNDFSVGLNFGIAFDIKKISIDVRYERGLSENEATFITNNGIDIENKIDTRPDQLILSLSFIL